MSSEYVNNNYQLKVSEILTQLWGYKNFTYLPRTTNPVVYTDHFDDLTAVDDKFKDRMSYLGTPIMQPLDLQKSVKGQPIEMFTFPNEPIVEIQGTKKIIETDIDGNDGSFKELYSLGDYAITIRGVAVNENHEQADDYPEEIIRQLRTAYELKNHLEVRGPLFTIFNIKYITFYDFKLPRIEGALGMQPYEFLAKSDKVFDLELKKK